MVVPKPQLTDKLLPNPPIAQVTTLSPSKASRSLIDASEKPLRRSPPGKPHQEEDWPALFPEKPTTPGTLQQMARQEDPYPSVRAMRIAHRERLSALANVESKIPSIQRKAVPTDSQATITETINRKPVNKSGLSNLRDTSENKLAADTDSSSKTVREVRSEHGLRISAFKEHIPRVQTPSPHTVVQKSVDRFQDLSYSRPTQISSLRARAPTGRPSTEVPSSSTKAPNLEEATTSNNNSATTGIKGSGSKSEPMAASSSPLARLPTNTTGGVGLSQGERSPSKLTVRTRYQGIPIRSSSNTSSPLLYSPPPNKPLPPVPKSQGPSQPGLRANGIGSKTSTPEPRKSSIPVLRRQPSGRARNLSSDAEVLTKTAPKPNAGRSAHETRKETSLRLLQNAVTVDSMVAVEKSEDAKAVGTSDTAVSIDRNGDILYPTRFQDQINCGNPVTEDSNHGTRVKRLSRLSPDYGPVLKISSSADKVIMGTGSSKEESITPHSKNNKDLHRAVVTKQLRKASFGGGARPTTSEQTQRPRPSSAAGNLQSPPRHIATDSKVRERKAMSADATYPWPTPAQIQEFASNESLKAKTSEKIGSGLEDPFFDGKPLPGSAAEANHRQLNVGAAVELNLTPLEMRSGHGPNDTKSGIDDAVESEHIQIYIEGGASSNDQKASNFHEGKADDHTDVKNDAASNKVAGDEPGTSPNSDRQGRARFGGQVPSRPALPPVTVQEHPLSAQNGFNPEPVTQDAVPKSCKLRHKPGFPIDIGDGNGSPSNQMVTIDEMLTPPRKSTSIPGTCLRSPPNWGLDEFPPRSSSRAYVQDFTTERYQTCPVSAKLVDPRLSKDFQPIQEKLGSSKGVPSIRYDPEASRSRCNSSARDSNKTQGSLSKGMLSNIRGLFHKRSSDGSDPPSVRSSKSDKRVAITSAGSPYPPISEVHPIHRPVRYRKVGSTTRPATPEPLIGVSSRADTLASHSPKPSDTSITNSLTLQLIDSAKRAPPGPRQDRLWELSSIMVQTVTNARDAEKAKEEAKQAMEQAKHAARKAEMSCILTHRRAADLARFVQEHREVLE